MNIRLGEIKITPEQKQIVNEILDSGQLTEGKYTKLFEESVAKFLDVKHVIAVSNGTVALELIGNYYRTMYRSQVVCVPATTFPATINAFINTGHRIILCDVGTDLTMNLDSLSEDEKAAIDIIVPVALLGYPPNMDKIMEEARERDWQVVEDFAEAFGTKYDGQSIGTIGNFGTSSFYVSHVIQAGELGIITTNNDDAARILRSMKNHGRVGSSLIFNHEYIGTNNKVTEFVTGICYDQMKRAEEIIARRQQIVFTYENGIDNGSLSQYPCIPNCSYLGYPILAIDEEYKNTVCKRLNDNGIETRGLFPCLANQKAYEGMHFTGGWKYPVSDDLERRGFYIPCHQYLTDEEVAFVIKVLNDG